MEVLIALAALGTALVAMLYGVSNAVVAINSTANDRTAMNIARSQMEYIQAQSFDNDAYIHYLKLPKRSLPADITPDDIYILPERQSDYLQKITVTVNYVGRDAVLEDYKPNHRELTYSIFGIDVAGGDSGVISVDGDGWQIQGDIHANGKPGEAGSVTLTKSGDKTYTVNGDITAYGDEPNVDAEIVPLWGLAQQDDVARDSPITYTQAEELGYPTFDFTKPPLDSYVFNYTVDLNEVPDVWEDWTENPETVAGNTRLKPGIYYFGGGPNTKIIVLSASPFHDTDDPERVVTITGKVTFAGESVKIMASDIPEADKNNFILSPYAKGILVWATKKGEGINITANNSIFSGALYAPEGKIEIKGLDSDGNEIPVTNDVFAGMAVAQEVEIYGEDSSIGF